MDYEEMECVEKTADDAVATFTPMQEYINNQRSVGAAISTLKHIGGSLEFNPYKDAIIRLEGVVQGMRMCEYAVDL